MTYQITNWIGSDWKAEKEPMMQPGEYDLYIRNASYDPEIGLYRMTVEDVQTEQVGHFSWYTITKTGDVNKISVGTLITLGKSLFDQDIGVPFPEDVKHGVVHAKVEPGKPYVNSKGETVQYPRIYCFEPACKSIYVLVAESGREMIEQYTADDTEGSQ